MHASADEDRAVLALASCARIRLVRSSPSMLEPGIVLRAYRAEDEAGVLRVWWDAWHSISADLTHPDPC